MRKTYVCACLLSALTAALAAAPAPTQEFTSQEGGFSVMTPAVLEDLSQEIDTQMGQIQIHMFGGEADGAWYAVSYNDYPEGAISASDPETSLDGARDGMVANINGQLAFELKVSLDGYPGREIVVDIRSGDVDATVKARVFLVGNRLYQLLVVAPKGTVGMDRIDAFLQSLRLLES